MSLVEQAALLPFPSHVLTCGSGPHVWLGGPTALIKSRFARLLVVIKFLLSFILILYNALNPRSQSGLHGDRVSTAISNFMNSSEMHFPPRALYIEKPKMSFLFVEK